MALTESRLRQIIKEEARRALRESTGKVATMDAVARALRNMENPEADDLADKIERYNRSHGGTTSIEFDERDDGTVKAYEREGSRTGNYMFDVPDDIYKELRSSLSDRLSERRRPTTGSRISESRVKQIILEETRRARRALREGDDDMGGEANAYLTIFDVSMLADAMDMSVEDFDLMVQDVAEQRMPGRIQFVGGDSGGHGPDPEPYDEEQDSYTVMGNKRDLERLVSALESEIQGSAQSIEDDEGLDYEISEF